MKKTIKRSLLFSLLVASLSFIPVSGSLFGSENTREGVDNQPRVENTAVRFRAGVRYGRPYYYGRPYRYQYRPYYYRYPYRPYYYRPYYYRPHGNYYRW